VLTISEATVYNIYPIVALRIFLNGTLVHPLKHEKRARQSRNRWLTVNVETCITREHQGYICEGNTLQAQDICLDTEQNVCHFETYPKELTNTVVVYIGEGCACLKTSCDKIQTDGSIKAMKNHSNSCVCHFKKLNSCDFNYSPPITSYQLMRANYTLIQKLQPVPIGISLNLVKELLQHKDLNSC